VLTENWRGISKVCFEPIFCLYIAIIVIVLTVLTCTKTYVFKYFRNYYAIIRNQFWLKSPALKNHFWYIDRYNTQNNSIAIVWRYNNITTMKFVNYSHTTIIIIIIECVFFFCISCQVECVFYVFKKLHTIMNNQNILIFIVIIYFVYISKYFKSYRVYLE